jgi:hypothetical protein
VSRVHDRAHTLLCEWKSRFERTLADVSARHETSAADMRKRIAELETRARDHADADAVAMCVGECEVTRNA